MNLDELRTFLEVIDSGSLVAAARRLHVTPSTVTARLSALEAEIGQKLLHRNKAGAELTSAGFKLQRYAELMTQLWRQARYEVSLPQGFEGVCNVGLEFDLWRELGERFLEYVQAHCPGVAVALWPGERHQLDRWLCSGLVDLALCYRPQAGEDFASRALFDDPLWLVATRPSRGVQLDSSYVYVDHGDEFRRQHAAAFPGERPASITIASSDWALEHLLRRGGQGYLPRRHVAALVAGGTLHRVAGAPEFQRRVYVVESTPTVQRWAWYPDAIRACLPAVDAPAPPAG